MRSYTPAVLLAALLAANVCLPSSASGQERARRTAAANEPDWTTAVIKRGEDRQQTNSTDILLRPYRPLHFYGNTVRRRHYRGTAVPTGRDIVQTLSAIRP